VSFVIGFFLLITSVHAQVMDLDSANVEIEIIGEGGHTGKCVKVIIRSLSKVKQKLQLKAGALFKSNNPAEQDLLLVEHIEPFSLEPNAEFSKLVAAFCTQSGNKSPASEAKFSLGKANKKLRELAVFIADNDLVSNAFVQQAVWAVSNDHSVAGIDYRKLDKGTQKLLKMVCALKGEQMPWYFVTYHAPDSTAAFSGVVKSVEGDISFNLAHNDVVTIVLFDQYKQTVKVFADETPYNQGRHSLSFTLSGKEVRPGTYTLKIYNNSRLLKEKVMKL